MHGHGSKPHLCLFKDCKRAQKGNGFPRRWNLEDHLKRVHKLNAVEASKKMTEKRTLRKGYVGQKYEGPLFASSQEFVESYNDLARKAKVYVPPACVNCKKRKLKCEPERPCRRCLYEGEEVCEYRGRLSQEPY